MYFLIAMIIAIILGIKLRKYIKKRNSYSMKPRKSKIKIFFLSIGILLIFGIFIGFIDKKDTSIQWKSKVDNLIWNYQYNVADNINDISTMNYNEKTDEEFILIINKNSKDKIKVIPLYSNGFSNLEERLAKQLDGKIRKKYNGFEIFKIKNGSQTSVYIYPNICYVEYYKKDGKMENTYLVVTKSIFGGAL